MHACGRQHTAVGPSVARCPKQELETLHRQHLSSHRVANTIGSCEKLSYGPMARLAA